MMRVSLNSQVGLKALRQSQKLFFSSAHVTPPLSLCPMSLLKAKHDMEIADMTERLQLERKKHDAEIKYSLEKQNIHLKYFDEQLNPQVRNVNSEQNTSAEVIEIEKDTVPKEASPTVSIPSLFKNEDEINSFCVKFYHKINGEFTPEIAQKIVYVLRNYPDDEFRARYILCGVQSSLFKENHPLICQILSAAGFGNALSAVISAQSTNISTLKSISRVFSCDLSRSYNWNMCTQDLFDAIDSHTGYNGAIFDALLAGFQAEYNSSQNYAAIISVVLINKTKLAKQIMIEKGFRSVVNAMPFNNKNVEALKQALNQV